MLEKHLVTTHNVTPEGLQRLMMLVDHTPQDWGAQQQQYQQQQQEGRKRSSTPGASSTTSHTVQPPAFLPSTPVKGSASLPEQAHTAEDQMVIGGDAGADKLSEVIPDPTEEDGIRLDDSKYFYNNIYTLFHIGPWHALVRSAGNLAPWVDWEKELRPSPGKNGVLIFDSVWYGLG